MYRQGFNNVRFFSSMRGVFLPWWYTLAACSLIVSGPPYSYSCSRVVALSSFECVDMRENCCSEMRVVLMLERGDDNIILGNKCVPHCRPTNGLQYNTDCRSIDGSRAAPSRPCQPRSTGSTVQYCTLPHGHGRVSC